MCQTCSALRTRLTSLLLRINNTREWNKTAHDLRGSAYRYILKGVEQHWKQTNHFVDSLDVMTALGKRALAGLKE